MQRGSTEPDRQYRLCKSGPPPSAALPHPSVLGGRDPPEWGFPGGAVLKNPLANAGDVRDVISFRGSGREEGPPGGGHGNPLQESCLENPMDRGTQRATVHRVTQSQTRLE